MHLKLILSPCIYGRINVALTLLLGRNRRLQGLACAMVKLWETSAIAKIAIKRGVQNTCNDRMAEELKVRNCLTYA